MKRALLNPNYVKYAKYGNVGIKNMAPIIPIGNNFMQNNNNNYIKSQKRGFFNFNKDKEDDYKFSQTEIKNINQDIILMSKIKIDVENINKFFNYIERNKKDVKFDRLYDELWDIYKKYENFKGEKDINVNNTDMDYSKILVKAYNINTVTKEAIKQIKEDLIGLEKFQMKLEDMLDKNEHRVIRAKSALKSSVKKMEEYD